MTQPYRLTDNTRAANAQLVLRESDGATIADDPGNADYIAYRAWLAGGNTPDPAPAVIGGLRFYCTAAARL
jgi:hypothetical protein